MGSLVLQVVPQGHGWMAKLIDNTLAAVNAAAPAEGLVVAGPPRRLPKFGLK